MDQNAKKIGLINWVVLLLATIGMLLVTRYVSTAAGVLGTALAGFGLFVALMSYFQMSLLEREHFERLELEELSKSRGSESLFAGAGEDTFPAKRSRELFERYFVPALTGLLFLLQAAAAYWPWKMVASMPPIIASRATLAMSLLGLLGLILFLLGKYSSGLVRLQGQKLLRPGAVYLMLNAYACFLITADIAATFLAVSIKTDLIVARFLCVVVGLIALETLFGLILEIYRVRVRGGETRVLYESRLVGLLGQPEAIITTAAHALDYQFGFKVSESWFYRFLEKALGWLILAQFGILVLSSCFVVINAGDQALLERFGQPLGQTGIIGPGLHFKLPWPIDKTINYHTAQVQTFIVGAEPETRSTIIWTVPHAKEENFLVASRGMNPAQLTNDVVGNKSPPVNLLSVSIPVQYQITNLTAWAYINKDPEALLQEAALREVVHYLASADFDELMSRDRAAAGDDLRNNIQGAADALQLGARVIFVGLEDIHPPQKVAAIFEQVVGAAQTRDSKILQALAYAVSTNAAASAEASNRVWAAEAFAHQEVVTSAARAMLFTNQALAYAAAPGDNGVYEQRAKLEAWVSGSRQARKYVIATTNTPDILIFDLEDKIRPDLLERMPEPSPLPSQK